MGLFSNSDIAVDVGTANTCIFARGAVALSEPSLVAYNNVRGTIEAIGTDAREMLGRTPGNITAIRPMKGGVIADFEAVEKMLAHFVRKVNKGRVLVRPRLVIGVPPEITPVERRAVKESAAKMKASEVYLVDEPMAAAIGAGLPVVNATGNMIIDVGGGTTNIAVISMAGVVYGRSLRVAGDDLDAAILQYMKRKHNLLIGEPTAEQIKIDIGSAAPLENTLFMDVKGRHLADGVPRTVLVTDGEIREALSEPVKAIVKAVREALESIPPELCGDIVDRGVVLTGGGALLRNFDKRLREETELPVVVADNPLATVVLGAGKLLTESELLKRVAGE
ncbi:MAG: rod shape-determining protein [Vicinamibacterales bacterium]